MKCEMAHCHDDVVNTVEVRYRDGDSGYHCRSLMLCQKHIGSIRGNINVSMGSAPLPPPPPPIETVTEKFFSLSGETVEDVEATALDLECLSKALVKHMRLLADELNSAISIAWVHGWRGDQKRIDEGQSNRDAIRALYIKIYGEDPDWLPK